MGIPNYDDLVRAFVDAQRAFVNLAAIYAKGPLASEEERRKAKERHTASLARHHKLCTELLVWLRLRRLK